MAVGFPTKANWAAGDVLTASAMDDLAGTVNIVQYLKPWNQVLNSNMSIWQRGTSTTSTNGNGYFAADRWKIYSGASGRTISQQSTNDTTNLPNIQYCSRVARDSGNTSTGAITYWQNFETLNSKPFAGKAVTFSFYARAGANYSSASNVLNAILRTGTGTDQDAFYSGYTGQVDAINVSATLTTTWQRFSYTATLGATVSEIATGFTFNPVGTAGAADYYEITGVQLEQGTVANTYQPNGSTYQAELAACQRYYVRFTGNSNAYYGIINAYSTTQGVAYTALPVPMRVTPTAVDYASIGYVVNAAGGITAVTPSINAAYMSPYVAALVYTSTGFTASVRYDFGNQGTTAGYLGLSAEL
jgi:hypothetical protein